MACWERIDGCMFNQLLLGFAEAVLYKLPTEGPRANPDGNMRTRWLEGTFLGFGRSSNSYVIGTDDGVVAARTICRQPSENRFGRPHHSSYGHALVLERQERCHCQL